MAPWLPGRLEGFVGLMLPELRRRGVFGKEYASRTLREHLELERPAHGKAVRSA